MPCVQLLNSFCYREMWRLLNSWLLCTKFQVIFHIFRFLCMLLVLIVCEIGAFNSWCAAMFWFRSWCFINDGFDYIFNGCSYADVSVPRYVRVNTLKLDVDSALLELRKNYSVIWSKHFWLSIFYILVKMFTEINFLVFLGKYLTEFMKKSSRVLNRFNSHFWLIRITHLLY